jgi:hypothetical protein
MKHFDFSVDETSKSPVIACCTKYLDGIRIEIIDYAEFSRNGET